MKLLCEISGSVLDGETGEIMEYRHHCLRYYLALADTGDFFSLLIGVGPFVAMAAM